MHKRIKELAKYSGFVFWEDDESIDWSSNYDKEFETFCEHLVREVVDMQKHGTNAVKFFGMKKQKWSNMEVEFKDPELELQLHRMAREQGITLDKLVEHVLTEQINRERDNGRTNPTED
jgi:hypothetical protein